MMLELCQADLLKGEFLNFRQEFPHVLQNSVVLLIADATKQLWQIVELTKRLTTADLSSTSIDAKAARGQVRAI
eukprot:11866930-Karenia_brevis.AAC.1